MKYQEYASCDSPFACAAAPILSRKWVPVVVCHLLNGPKRFSELKKAIPRISAKVLAENLEFLQQEEMLLREVRGEQPMEVWYKLTERGNDVSRVIQAMNAWGERWLRQPTSGYDANRGAAEESRGMEIPLAAW